MTKILVVDDEKDCLFLFESILKTEGYQVDGYNDPLEVLSEYRRGYYDLIIVDYRMARLDAKEFIEKLRAVDTSVKVMLVTAWDIQSLATDIQKSCIKVLRKPITGEQLVEEVRLALNHTKVIGPID
ncbi:MAG TPA: response regulator [Nitrososphaeraceae archaeon]|jgi:DNA-binding NtrC family response regulator